MLSVIPIPRVDGIISTPSVIRRSLHYVLDVRSPYVCDEAFLEDQPNGRFPMVSVNGVADKLLANGIYYGFRSFTEIRPFRTRYLHSSVAFPVVLP